MPELPYVKQFGKLFEKLFRLSYAILNPKIQISNSEKTLKLLADYHLRTIFISRN